MCSPSTRSSAACEAALRHRVSTASVGLQPATECWTAAVYILHRMRNLLMITPDCLGSSRRIALASFEHPSAILHEASRIKPRLHYTAGCTNRVSIPRLYESRLPNVNGTLLFVNNSSYFDRICALIDRATNLAQFFFSFIDFLIFLRAKLFFQPGVINCWAEHRRR
jgi:hypothetical protein